MGKTKGPYQEEFPVGSVVRTAENCNGAGRFRPEDGEGKVRWVYHGGDQLYQIEGVPGIWHECCLESMNTDL